MTETRVITDDAKFQFLALIKKLGHPSIGLDKELGVSGSIYDHFLTRQETRNRETRSLILYLLDFGVKCNLTEATVLQQESLLQYCTRQVYWDPEFVSEDIDRMISWIELRWTEKLTGVLHNLQNYKIDINFRLKDLLLDINEVFVYSNVDSYIQV